MEILHQIVSLILPLGLLIALLYLMAKVRRTIVQLQKFEKLFRALREANTRTRFMATNAKDKVALLETSIEDLQNQIDALLHNSYSANKDLHDDPLQ